jgi:phage terminase Nu1 subunit (DNA packaging protein)
MSVAATLPVPLLTQSELETYYRVSDWTVNKWVREGCPVERLRSGSRRFDLDKVRAWHAGEDGGAAKQAMAARSQRALSRRSA